MTDLNSTVDSVRDEKDLLSRIENNSKINIFTTVVGIGMDFNVSLVQKISCTVQVRNLAIYMENIGIIFRKYLCFKYSYMIREYLYYLTLDNISINIISYKL